MRSLDTVSPPMLDNFPSLGGKFGGGIVYGGVFSPQDSSLELGMMLVVSPG